MSIVKLTLMGILCVLSSVVLGQDYAFRVLATKGSNEYKSGESWQPLKTGASLKTTDELRLGDNAYIGLVHKKGEPLELKQAGSHKVSDLEAKINGGTSVLVKYTDFILSSNSAEAKKNKLVATGAVHRAVEKSPINLMLPPNQFSGVYNSSATFRWDSEKASGPYVVTFRNMFDDVLDKVETPEKMIEVDLTNKKFATENAILVEVSAKADPKLISEQHLMKRLTPAQQESVKSSLNEIITTVGEPTALNNLILAGFYEENNLLIDAISAYEAAIRLAPDVPSYGEAYDEFLLRHGLKN